MDSGTTGREVAGAVEPEDGTFSTERPPPQCLLEAPLPLTACVCVRDVTKRAVKTMLETHRDLSKGLHHPHKSHQPLPPLCPAIMRLPVLRPARPASSSSMTQRPWRSSPCFSTATPPTYVGAQRHRCASAPDQWQEGSPFQLCPYFTVCTHAACVNVYAFGVGLRF
jgi:hypothetical protein